MQSFGGSRVENILKYWMLRKNIDSIVKYTDVKSQNMMIIIIISTTTTNKTKIECIKFEDDNNG